MSDRQSNLPPKVTLEDLLHLKRVERPEPEFWAQFERDLRQKQLAALVARRSWWLEVSAAFSRFGGVRLPLGAMAVLALSFFTVRYYANLGPVSPAPRTGDAFRPAESLAAAHPRETSRPTRLTAVAELSSAAGATALAKTGDTPETTEGHQDAPGEASAVIPWLGDVVVDRSASPELTPSARLIAAHLAAVAALEPDLVGAIARPLGFEERAMPASGVRHTAEVLPTAAAVTDSRHARLLAALGSAGIYSPEPAAPEHARRSVLRYLTEDGWDRSMGRLEAEGDKLSIKF